MIRALVAVPIFLGVAFSPVIAGLMASAAFGQDRPVPTERPALDQNGCGERDVVTGILAQNYGEAPTRRGLAANGTMYEWFENTKTDTWTIVISKPDGTTCMHMGGVASDRIPYVDPRGTPA